MLAFLTLYKSSTHELVASTHILVHKICFMSVSCPGYMHKSIAHINCNAHILVHRICATSVRYPCTSQGHSICNEHFSEYYGMPGKGQAVMILTSVELSMHGS